MLGIPYFSVQRSTVTRAVLLPPFCSTSSPICWRIPVSRGLWAIIGLPSSTIFQVLPATFCTKTLRICSMGRPVATTRVAIPDRRNLE